MRSEVECANINSEERTSCDIAAKTVSWSSAKKILNQLENLIMIYYSSRRGRLANVEAPVQPHLCLVAFSFSIRPNPETPDGHYGLGSPKRS